MVISPMGEPTGFERRPNARASHALMPDEKEEKQKISTRIIGKRSMHPDKRARSVINSDVPLGLR